MEPTPRAAKKALETARQLALDFGHARVCSQHIVFGLFHLGSGVHFSVLQRLGFSSDRLRQAIAAEPPVEDPSTASSDNSVTAALHRAEKEATAMQHAYVGTEHILLGLLREENGGAASLFASCGVPVADARQMILQEMPPTIDP